MRMDLTSSSVSADNSANSKALRRNRDDISENPCSVCEAPTSGFHFGAVACAACSAFFRRTIVEKRKYVCRKTGPAHLGCPIDQQHRCYCRACRLKKCLDRGLDPNAVQPHRDAIGAKPMNFGKTDNNNRKNSEERPECCRETIRRIEEERPTVIQSEKPTIADQLNNILDNQARNDELKKAASSNAAIEQLIAFSKAAVIGCIGNSKPPTIESSSSEAVDDSPITENPQESVDSSADPSSEVQQQERPEPESSSIEASTSESPSSTTMFSDKLASYDRTQNVIEMVVDAYEAMQERRRLINCPRSIKDILSGTPPVQRKSRWGERFSPEKMRIEVAFLAEFINAIHPFSKFSLNDRIELMRNVALPFTILEMHYITMKMGGMQTNRLYHPDYSYSDLNDVDSLIPEGAKSRDIETLKKLFLEPGRVSIKQISSAMEQSGMSLVELCALTAVMLFDPTIRNLDASSRRLVKSARDKVYADWFSYYAHRGMRVDIASERVGNAMLLLPVIQQHVERKAENFTIIRVFELLNYDKLLDDLV